MATLRAIKRRIGSVKSTQKITRSMYMVAAARLRRAQDNIVNARPYAYRLRKTLSHVAALVDRQAHSLLAQREETKSICFVIVTADRGLCGAFNSNIIRQTKKILEEYKDLDISLICIGRKARDHFKKYGYNVIGQYTDFFSDLTFDNAQSIVDQITELYLQKKLDKAVLIYNEFKSAIQQNVVTENLLPLEPDEKEGDTGFDYIYEPDPESVLSAIVPLNLNIQMWRVLLESFAAEQGARMTAMDNATENAKEMINKLTLIFNRTRQAAITKEISEIVGGAEALK